MLRVEDVHVVRDKVLVDGLSRRRVAREMGISRNTVRRYMERPEPVRVERKPRRRPVLERVQPPVWQRTSMPLPSGRCRNASPSGSSPPWQTAVVVRNQPRSKATGWGMRWAI